MKTELYKILIVDDEIWIRENLKLLISSTEFGIERLEAACDGEDALEKIGRDCPDVVITDINMPFIDGIELIKRIRNINPEIVVVVLSGYSDFDFVREALLEGAIDYILKPISQNSIWNVLNKAFRVIEGKRQKSAEIRDNMEKLLIASSIINDKELSDLIDGDEKKPVRSITNPKLLEMELNFAKFNLVLIKTDRLNNILKKFPSMDSSKVSYRIKNIMEECIGHSNAIVFNNIYVPNEFISVIIDRDRTEVDKICDRLISKLQEFTKSYISAAVSLNHFSFDDLRDSYNEGLLAMMARRYRQGNSKLYAQNVEKLQMNKLISAEQENQLIFAVQNCNKKIIRTIIYEQICIQDLHIKDILFLEVKQTIDRIAWILVNHSDNFNSPSEIMEVDTLVELLNISIEKFNLSEVCSILDQIVDSALKENYTYSPNETIKKTIETIKNYISENYFEELSLSSLAKQFLVDRSYLSKVFKNETGENLMLYIAKKRIEKSIELIKDGSVNLTDISSLVGYDDYAYFNRVFRKITGKSPREYKLTLQDNSKNRI